MPTATHHAAVLAELRQGDLDRVIQEDQERLTFVLFDHGTPQDRLAAAALAGAARELPDRVRAFRAPATQFAEYFASMSEGKRAFDTYDFQRFPVIGIYRAGRLLTTFNPRKVFYDPKVQQRETRTQLEIFIRKFGFYDPTQVREQSNLEVAIGDGAKEAAKGAGS